MNRNYKKGRKEERRKKQTNKQKERKKETKRDKATKKMSGTDCTENSVKNVGRLCKTVNKSIITSTISTHLT